MVATKNELKNSRANETTKGFKVFSRIQRKDAGVKRGPYGPRPRKNKTNPTAGVV